MLDAVPEQFWEQLAAAKRRVLLLDYDGTLAPFVVQRDQAVPYPGVREQLAQMQSAGHSRIVVISGRASSDLLPLLGLDHRPEIWGSHGLEQLKPDGEYRVGELDSSVGKALKRAEKWAAGHGHEQRIERKPGCVALHVRGLAEPESRRLLAAAEQAWGELAGRLTGEGGPHDRPAVVLRPFDGGLELRQGLLDKGSAVDEALRQEGRDSVIAYLGDDLTDEDAFAALDGRGLRVLVRAEPRDSAADVRIEPPDGLLEFLRRWHVVASG